MTKEKRKPKKKQMEKLNDSLRKHIQKEWKVFDMKMETFLNSQKRRKVKFDPVDVNPEERDPFCELILFFFFFMVIDNRMYIH